MKEQQEQVEGNIRQHKPPHLEMEMEEDIWKIVCLALNNLIILSSWIDILFYVRILDVTID